MAAPPVINGFIFTEQTVAPGQTIDPFSKVSISDSVLDATDSATIWLITSEGTLIRTFSDDNGTLVGPGLSGGAGDYTLSATDPATLSSELDNLTFIPAPLPSGVTSVSTKIELDVSRTNDTNPATTDSTVVTDTAPAPPPPLPPPPQPIPGANLLLQNTTGSVAIWDMNGTTIAAGGLVGSNPGPTWHIKGTGNFFNDGNAALLLQNDDGSVALWDTSGTSVIGGGVVTDPGPTWRIEGTGNFFGDGNTDIVLQNEDGSVALWDMSGTSVIGGGLVENPGPNWHIEGTGNFFGDGNTAILLQNDDGSVALWHMSGTNVIGGGLVANPGPTWHIEGTGDFFGDGNTDIVFQNNDGSVALWDMNGINVIGGGLVATNPGPAWHIGGTGDFFGDSHTDIVLQNDAGSVALWDMSGTSVIGGGVAGNPGTGWNVSDDNMRFIYSTSANETLVATPATPDEFVFTSFAAGSHTISGLNPVQDMIALSKAQFASFTNVQAATSAISGGTMINLGKGSSLLLPGVNPASLHASDFALV